ncbi:MAG TPA: flagellar hook-associated protein 3, partial [Cellvibrionaceae bacterium]|nr:flagellar hook-associated protein 3 [Cellvibrionaceae bacterium]
VVASTLDNLNFAQTSVLNVVSTIGARVNTLDSTESQHLDTKVVGEKVLSDLSHLDYAEAATRLSQQSMVLEATQQSFIRVSQLTLFSKL